MKLEHRDITLRIPADKLTLDEIEDIIIRFKYAVDKMYKECGANDANLMTAEMGNTWTKVRQYLLSLKMET